jgi:hypothetical protein|tara:strand:- start:1404 stop:2177 length:774 start_codon:yes stop_codon:yes gene_type:complete
LDPKSNILRISKKLEEIEFNKEPGSILYSGNETLTEGDYYFLGLNPGGNTNISVSSDTVMNQLRRKDTNFNEYFQGIWKERNKPATSPGMAILQLRIKTLFSRLGIDLRKTFSSNLVFVRSPVLSELHLNWNDAGEKCWEVHKVMLSIVKPKIILVFGDDARDFIRKKMIVKTSDLWNLESTNKEYIFGCITGSLLVGDSNEQHEVCLISTPHLRRFKIDAKGLETNSAYDARLALNWMDKKIKENLTLLEQSDTVE